MEYTKDMVLEINYKDENKNNFLRKCLSWTSKLYNFIRKNKLISITLFIFTTLTVIDIALVNSFLQILAEW